MLLDQAEGQAAQPREVFHERAVADPAFVFPVGHVERPVQRVLDAPVPAHGLGELPAVATQAAEVVPDIPLLDPLLFVDPVEIGM